MMTMTKASDDLKRRGAPKKDPNNVRSERVNIVLTPNTLNDLKALTALENESMNNFIHELIDKEVEKNKDRLEEYREFMERMNK